MDLNLRNIFFWIIDFFKGGLISSNFKEVKSINETDDELTIIEYQNKRIKELLEYSKKNIRFYKNIKTTELEEFPVLDKLLYKNDIASFCSPKFDKSRLYKAITSGSTGTPFVSYQNKSKRNRNTADALYFSTLAGYKLGETLFYLKIWSENNNKSNIQQLFQNIVPVDVIQLSKGKIEEFLNKIENNKRSKHINGYSSALEEICKYLDSKDKRYSIESIITQSEGLSEHTKVRLNKYFNCLPCSRYSNLENGIIAQQTLKENRLFKINRASYKLEILDMHEDKPANLGELGRIVITDFFNFAMPFIRYDSGDIGKFFTNDDGTINYNYLEDIQGRKLDLLLDTRGNIISSYIMYKNMFKYPEIDQYQLIQEDKRRYRFIISIKKEFIREDQLKKEFLKYLGKDANFQVEYIDKIPLLSSGKRRKIVNNYLKKINR